MAIQGFLIWLVAIALTQPVQPPLEDRDNEPHRQHRSSHAEIQRVEIEGGCSPQQSGRSSVMHH